MTPTQIKLRLGIMLFATWLGLVIYKVENAGDIINAIKAALVGLGAYHLNDRTNLPAPPAVNAVPNKEAGFARPVLLLLIACAASLAMAGCGTLNAYTSAALSTQQADYAGARKNAQVASDAAFKAWTDAACTLPLGALQRNDTGNPGAPAAAMAACPPVSAGMSAIGSALPLQPATVASPVTVVQTK